MVPTVNPMSGSSTTPLMVSWDLADRHVLVVGADVVGTAKVERLLATGAAITVVAPSWSSRISDLVEADRISGLARRFRPGDVRGAALVVAATDDPRRNRSIRRWARLAGALTLSVDDPADADVHLPATIRRGDVTVAISTDGGSPAAARFLREELAEVVPDGVGELVRQAAQAREQLRATARYRYDYPAWRQRFLEPGLEAVRAGRVGALDELRRRFLAEFDGATPIRTGRVTLVGAGPGGADLITVRGARALAEADVVLYDSLADAELLDLAPAAAVRVPVGKRKGRGMSQDDIARLLIDHAARGHHVVRLKGGDPFVFGRGTEEADAVRAAGLPVEVVPGLSSALTAPALAGIAVTERHVASGFTVVSGHRAGPDDENWEALAASGLTIVVLMAATTADRVATRLLAAGRADEPAAFIHAAGTSSEAVAVRSLSDVAASGCPFGSPTVMVIGPVAERAAGAAAPAHELARSLHPAGAGRL